MTFTGHSVALVASKSPNRGKAKVYIDGTYVKTISTKSSIVDEPPGRLHAGPSAAGGTHTISIAPTGHGTYRLFRIDAFVVGR